MCSLFRDRITLACMVVASYLDYPKQLSCKPQAPMLLCYFSVATAGTPTVFFWRLAHRAHAAKPLKG
jgi:hypothetical protein